MKTLIINENIETGLTGEKSLWSIWAESIENAKTLSLTDLRYPLSSYLNTEKPDIVLFNSILGNIFGDFKCRKVCLLQDNYVLMRAAVGKKILHKIKLLAKKIMGRKDFYADRVEKQFAAIEVSDVVVGVSAEALKSYMVSDNKKRIILNGVNAETFSPLVNKAGLRSKYNLPVDKKVKIFVGSTHWVKGFDALIKEIKRDRQVFYILVLKNETPPKLNLDNARIFCRIPHQMLRELYNASDLCVGRSKVETFWQAPIEAMFCGVPVDVTPVGVFADWKPENKDPRAEAFAKGLDQETMIRRWQELLKEISL